MTAQSSEILILQKRPYVLKSLPLDPYLKSWDFTFPELTRTHCTGNYRGYLGCWEIFDDSLYLIGIFDIDGRPFDKSVFDWKMPVKADWFTGRLDVDSGDLLLETYAGWSSVRANRTRLYFENGRFKRRVRVDQAKRLRKRYDMTPDQELEYRQWLAERGDLVMGGLTQSGFSAIGREPFENERVCSSIYDEGEDTAWMLPMIDICVRPHA